METEPRNDKDILKDVSETLAWDTRINDSQVKVKVNEGRVTLGGTVSLYSEKTAASEDAWRIKGVREVENELIVSPSDMRSDHQITDDVIEALRRDQRVNLKTITVSVAGGIVELAGTVGSLMEKKAALEDAWNTAGIIDITDNLTVTPTGTRPDAVIADDVQSALARDARISDATRINVDSIGGTVYLRGGVASIAERDAADEDARFTAGTVDVMNELVVVAE